MPAETGSDMIQIICGDAKEVCKLMEKRTAQQVLL